MAILGPSQLPAVLKVASEQIKMHVISQLGGPIVGVEISEPQMEQILRSTGDWIAGYFPMETRFAFFMTKPLESEYELPTDAWWIRKVSWDPAITNINQIFSAESFLFNIGNISGIQNLLTDYHLLQAYRKFSQRILSNEGSWDFSVNANTIRLFPVPKGTFPVVVEYIPTISEFKSPQSREITYRAVIAQMKIALGHARRKFGGIPGPDGSTITFDGDALVSEGREEYEKAQADAILLGEPLGPYTF